MITLDDANMYQVDQGFNLMKDDSPSYNLKDNNFTIGVASMKQTINYEYNPDTGSWDAFIQLKPVDLSNLNQLGNFSVI